MYYNQIIIIIKTNMCNNGKYIEKNIYKIKYIC